MIYATLIKVMHYIFIAFMLLTPFFGSEVLLTQHFIICPFLILHWLSNNDTCALTILESKLRGGVEDTQTFMGNLIKPIYNAHLSSKHYYWIVTLLFLITTYKLWNYYGFLYLILTWKVFLAALIYLNHKIMG
jgi:hypothetical protein